PPLTKLHFPTTNVASAPTINSGVHLRAGPPSPTYTPASSCSRAIPAFRVSSSVEALFVPSCSEPFFPISRKFPKTGNFSKPPQLLLFRIIAIIFFRSLNRCVGFRIRFICLFVCSLFFSCVRGLFGNNWNSRFYKRVYRCVVYLRGILGQIFPISLQHTHNKSYYIEEIVRFEKEGTPQEHREHRTRTARRDGSGSVSVRISAVFGSAVFGFGSQISPTVLRFWVPESLRFWCGSYISPVTGIRFQIQFQFGYICLDHDIVIIYNVYISMSFCGAQVFSAHAPTHFMFFRSQDRGRGVSWRAVQDICEIM
ncbi:Unknown protein, partial [Striga hermonthica]